MSLEALALTSSPVWTAFSASCSANLTVAPRPWTSAGSSAARVSRACAGPALTTVTAKVTVVKARAGPDIKTPFPPRATKYRSGVPAVKRAGRSPEGVAAVDHVHGAGHEARRVARQVHDRRPEL